MSEAHAPPKNNGVWGVIFYPLRKQWHIIRPLVWISSHPMGVYLISRRVHTLSHGWKQSFHLRFNRSPRTAILSSTKVDTPLIKGNYPLYLTVLKYLINHIQKLVSGRGHDYFYSLCFSQGRQLLFLLKLHINTIIIVIKQIKKSRIFEVYLTVLSISALLCV